LRLLALAAFVAVNPGTNIIRPSSSPASELKPSFRLPAKLPGNRRFQHFLYLVTIANMLIFKADRIVIGIMVGGAGSAYINWVPGCRKFSRR
jgi:hypothetical protein